MSTPHINISCAICGACNCAPSGLTLTSYIDELGLDIPISEDDVFWLNCYHIMGRLPAEDSASGSDLYFLTGPTRARKSGVRFLRGSVHGIEFGKGCVSAEGQNEQEVLVATYDALWDFLSETKKVLILHKNCYSIVLCKALQYVCQKTRGFESMASVDFNVLGPLLVDRRKRVREQNCYDGLQFIGRLYMWNFSQNHLDKKTSRRVSVQSPMCR